MCKKVCNKYFLTTVISLTVLFSLILWFIVLFTFDNKHFYLYNYYESERKKIINDEKLMSIGNNLILNNEEKQVNVKLMYFKHEEVNKGFVDPSKFLPAQNFLTANKKIEESQVFKIIKKMPKGAVLHSHDTAIVDYNYVLYNITYRDNLYFCDDQNGTIKLKFFDKPTTDCNWVLLKNLRQQNHTIDEIIKNKMTLMTENPNEKYKTVDDCWDKFTDIFLFITPFLTYKPVYEDHFYEGLRQLYEDNVIYLELRSTLPELYDLDGTVYGPVQVAEMYKNVTDKFLSDHQDFIGVKLIFAPLRRINDQEFEKLFITAKELRNKFPNFIAGFDVVGQEDKGTPLINFAQKLYKHLNSTNINLFFHAGETNWNGLSTDENLIDAVLLNSKRIGHGYAITKHPKIMELVKEREIAIEICPISNQVLGLVEDLRNHPASALFAQNFPIVVSNDDPGLWGSRGLSYDFYEAFMGIMSYDSDLRALKKLALNSIKYSSLDQNEKSLALNLWQKKWLKFLREFNRKHHIQISKNYKDH